MENSPCNYSAEKRPAKWGVNLSDWGNRKASIRLSGALNDSGAYSWTAVVLSVGLASWNTTLLEINFKACIFKQFREMLSQRIQRSFKAYLVQLDCFGVYIYSMPLTLAQLLLWLRKHTCQFDWERYMSTWITAWLTLANIVCIRITLSFWIWTRIVLLLLFVHYRWPFASALMLINM